MKKNENEKSPFLLLYFIFSVCYTTNMGEKVFGMKKKIYVDSISKQLGLSKKNVQSVVDQFVEELTEELVSEGKASITNFGTFKKKITKPFEFFSPQDGAKMSTNGMTKVNFTSSRMLLSRLRDDKDPD